MASEGTELEEYKEVFKVFDIDNDESITHEELKTSLNRLGYKLNDEQVQEMMDDADDDGDGTISESEFIRVVSGRPKPDKQIAHTRRMFRAFEVDGSGFITVDNMKEILSESGLKIDQESLKAIIAEGDTDGDGRINFEEFVVMVEAGGFFQ